MPRILVVASALDGTLGRSALELLGGARALAGDGGAEVLAARMIDGAAETLGRHGAAWVVQVSDAALSVGQTDAALIAVEAVMTRVEPDVVLVAADTVGRELAPRLAFRRQAALVTEAMELRMDGPAILARRQVYGGRAMATLAVTKRPAVISVKPRSFDAAGASAAAAQVEDLQVTIDADALPAVVKDVAAETAEVGLEEAH